MVVKEPLDDPDNESDYILSFSGTWVIKLYNILQKIVIFQFLK